jgi:hypothetical protein
MTVRLLAIVCCAFALGACGERPQEVGSSPVKKADTPAAAGASNAYVAPGWKTGDAASWDQQMRKRAQGQNEYSRIAGS